MRGLTGGRELPEPREPRVRSEQLIPIDAPPEIPPSRDELMADLLSTHSFGVEVEEEVAPLYEVGDVVVLLESSGYYTQAPGVEGRIVGIDPSSTHPYCIEWADNHHNYYRKRDVMRVEVTQSDKTRMGDEIIVGDVVKVIDVCRSYERNFRDRVIGLYYTVTFIERMFPLGWCSCKLRSTDPARATQQITGGLLVKVRLQRFVRPEEKEMKKDEQVDKVA